MFLLIKSYIAVSKRVDKVSGAPKGYPFGVVETGEELNSLRMKSLVSLVLKLLNQIMVTGENVGQIKDSMKDTSNSLKGTNSRSVFYSKWSASLLNGDYISKFR